VTCLSDNGPLGLENRLFFGREEKDLQGMVWGGPPMKAIWLISVICGLTVSYTFGLSYSYGSQNLALISFVLGSIIFWLTAFFSPLSIPVYKGILPAILPIVGMLTYGAIGFVCGWGIYLILNTVADWRRFNRLSKITGGATAKEIIPLQVVSLLVVWIIFTIAFIAKGAPAYSSGRDFLVGVLNHSTPNLLDSNESKPLLVKSIAILGAVFLGGQQFSVNAMARFFPR
jgi:hypothetical protein